LTAKHDARNGAELSLISGQEGTAGIADHQSLICIGSFRRTWGISALRTCFHMVGRCGVRGAAFIHPPGLPLMDRGPCRCVGLQGIDRRVFRSSNPPFLSSEESAPSLPGQPHVIVMGAGGRPASSSVRLGPTIALVKPR
jgi:hypothetical protein